MGIDVSQRGVELGPSFRPIVTKASGAAVETMDHGTRDEIIAKYREQGMIQEMLDAIEEVDHVWTGGPIRDAIPDHGAYHWVIASHFIEHSVDLIGFLQDCSTLLREGGVLSLIIPDKRLTFDRFRPLTSLGNVIDQHLAGTAFHPAGSLVDEAANAVRLDGNLSWWRGADGELSLPPADFVRVREMQAIGEAQDHYQDNHRWVFTPTSFALLVEDLAQLGHHDLVLEDVHSDDEYEFFVRLRKSSAPFVRTLDRLEAELTIERELFEATEVAAENARLRAELDDIYASKSWAITTPIRGAMTALRKLTSRNR